MDSEEDKETIFTPYVHRIEEDTLILNRYYVVEKLGDGCYAKVFLVQDIHTNEVFALKAIRKVHFKHNKKLRYMLDKEAKIHMSMNHPNIVKLYKYFEDKNYVFFLLEYVHPGELFTVLYDEDGFSEKDAAKYVYQTVLALKYCAEKGVMHRDLKPENLLLDEGDNIKLADFGWATTGTASSIVGSVHYNSPEMLRYQKYDYRSDIWSVGILIYELICCEQPFRGKGKNEREKERETERLIKRGLVRDSKYAKEMSDEAFDLITKILRINPKERPSYEQILAHPWIQQYCGDEFSERRSRNKDKTRSQNSSRDRSVERRTSRHTDSETSDTADTESSDSETESSYDR